MVQCPCSVPPFKEKLVAVPDPRRVPRRLLERVHLRGQEPPRRLLSLLQAGLELLFVLVQGRRDVLQPDIPRLQHRGRVGVSKRRRRGAGRPQLGRVQVAEGGLLQQDTAGELVQARVRVENTEFRTKNKFSSFFKKKNLVEISANRSGRVKNRKSESTFELIYLKFAFF